MFTITLDALRSHTHIVSKCAWNKLWRDPAMINQIEGEIEEVMTAAGVPCTVMLTPKPQSNLIEVVYNWISEGSVGDGIDKDNFLRMAVIGSLLEYVGVIVA